MEFAGDQYTAVIKARIFDIGVVSLIFHLEVPEDISYEKYQNLTIAVDSLPENVVREYIDAITDTIRPACTKMRISDFDEDFVVYYFKDKLPDWDLAALIMKDKTPLSEETRKDALVNRFSYSKDDVIYLTWDTAIMLDRTGSTDLPDLLEFANAQFLELRYYDDALRKAIDSTYDEIDKATEPGSRGKAKTFRKVRNELMEVMADMSVLTSNVDNALQVTEDVFNARVYARYMYLLRADVWRENINTKLKVLQRCYELLNTHHRTSGRSCGSRCHVGPARGHHKAHHDLDLGYIAPSLLRKQDLSKEKTQEVISHFLGLLYSPKVKMSNTFLIF